MIQVPPESSSVMSAKFFIAFNRSCKDGCSFFSCVPTADEDSVSDLPAFSSSVQSIVEVSMVKPPNVIVIRREQKRPSIRTVSFGRIMSGDLFGISPTHRVAHHHPRHRSSLCSVAEPFRVTPNAAKLYDQLMGESNEYHASSCLVLVFDYPTTLLLEPPRRALQILP